MGYLEEAKGPVEDELIMGDDDMMEPLPDLPPLVEDDEFMRL